jgi:cytochrome c
MRQFLLPLLLLLPAPLLAADAGHGQKLFLQCAACHGDHGQGSEQAPPLIGVVGRKAGSVEEFRYSAAMTRSKIIWDESSLQAFATDPQATVKGTRMPFDGLHDTNDAADVVAYIKGLK